MIVRCIVRVPTGRGDVCVILAINPAILSSGMGLGTIHVHMSVYIMYLYMNIVRVLIRVLFMLKGLLEGPLIGSFGGTPNRDPCSLWGLISGVPRDIGVI